MVGQQVTENQMTIRGEMPPDHHSAPTTSVPLGAGLPPISAKLVSRIEAGEFIEMSDLLCDHLGTPRGEDQKLLNAK